MNKTLSSALDYYERGWSVIPLRPRGKQPLPKMNVSQYQRERRAKPDEIAMWFSQSSDLNLGICTGAISGFFVLDCDEPSEYLMLHLLKTPMVATGRGAHFYFKMPSFPVGNRAGIIGGCDIRGTGGYIVAPPSIHPTGRVYQFDHDYPLADAPTWLLDKLRPKPVMQRTYPVFGNGGSFGSAALTNELTRLSNSGLGERNNQLNRSAFCLGQLVAGGELDELTVTGALKDMAQALGLSERESAATVQSGLKAGKSYPRTRQYRTVR